MKTNKAKITTTPSIEGWEISQYIDVVTTQIVAGTGVFSDALAGLSDFFGGRSESYQKQLDSIYNEAIQKIKDKAVSLGGNWVVGFKIDNDEISGKNKQMFMITASGTVVKAHKKNNSTDNSQSETEVFLDYDEYNNLYLENKLVKDFEKNKGIPRDVDWEFLLKKRSTEIFPIIIELMEEEDNNKSHEYTNDPVKSRKYIDYLECLPGDFLEESFTTLIESKINIDKIAKIIDKRNILNYSDAIRILNNKDLRTQNNILFCLKFNPSRYQKSDILKIKEILNILDTIYVNTAVIVEEKKMLSSATTTKWKCGTCDYLNAVQDKKCSSCKLDQFGLPPEINLEGLKNRLKSKISTLDNYFSLYQQ